MFSVSETPTRVARPIRPGPYVTVDGHNAYVWSQVSFKGAPAWRGTVIDNGPQYWYFDGVQCYGVSYLDLKLGDV